MPTESGDSRDNDDTEETGGLSIKQNAHNAEHTQSEIAKRQKLCLNV